MAKHSAAFRNTVYGLGLGLGVGVGWELVSNTIAQQSSMLRLGEVQQCQEQPDRIAVIEEGTVIRCGKTLITLSGLPNQDTIQADLAAAERQIAEAADASPFRIDPSARWQISLLAAASVLLVFTFDKWRNFYPWDM